MPRTSMSAFLPIAANLLCPSEMTRCANNGLMHRNKRYLFDDFVGATGQRQGDADAKRLGGLEVDEQLYLCGLLYRQISGFFALDPAGLDAGQVVCVRARSAIAQQTSGRDELARFVD